MKKAALITIHGMGQEDLYYYEKLEHGLEKLLKDDWKNISFQKVQYAKHLQDPQDEFWAKITSERSNDLDFTGLRKFFLYGFSDATSLEYSAHHEEEKYIQVQKEIQKALEGALDEFDGDVTRPVFIIAQSLGCQVVSNYLWDARHKKHIFKNPDSSGEKLEFLKGGSLWHLFTTGCNIPLFVGGLEKRQCFEKPNDEFEWDNYYDPDDVLGWPLRQLDESYKIVQDHHINAGGPLTGWNPASHVGYWSDSDVLRPLAKALQKVL